MKQAGGMRLGRLELSMIPERWTRCLAAHDLQSAHGFHASCLGTTLNELPIARRGLGISFPSF